jgi:hypothetical protein
MSQVKRLDDLWVIKILVEDPSTVMSPISGPIIIEQILVQAMTAACAADKWASYSGKKLRHISQRNKPESSVQFEAAVETDEPIKYRLQIFEAVVIT